jgi:hypothetical protein
MWFSNDMAWLNVGNNGLWLNGQTETTSYIKRLFNIRFGDIDTTY